MYAYIICYIHILWVTCEHVFFSCKTHIHYNHYSLRYHFLEIQKTVHSIVYKNFQPFLTTSTRWHGRHPVYNENLSTSRLVDLFIDWRHHTYKHRALIPVSDDFVPLMIIMNMLLIISYWLMNTHSSCVMICKKMEEGAWKIKTFCADVIEFNCITFELYHFVWILLLLLLLTKWAKSATVYRACVWVPTRWQCSNIDADYDYDYYGDGDGNYDDDVANLARIIRIQFRSYNKICT